MGQTMIGAGLAGRIDARAGEATHGQDGNPVAGNPARFGVVPGAMPDGGGVDVRVYLEGLNTAPAKSSLIGAVFGEGGKARVLMSAFAGLLGGKTVFAAVSGTAFSIGGDAPPAVHLVASEAQVQAAEAPEAPAPVEQMARERDQAIAQASVYASEDAIGRFYAGSSAPPAASRSS